MSKLQSQLSVRSTWSLSQLQGRANRAPFGALPSHFFSHRFAAVSSLNFFGWHFSITKSPLILIHTVFVSPVQRISIASFIRISILTFYLRAIGPRSISKK